MVKLSVITSFLLLFSSTVLINEEVSALVLPSISDVINLIKFCKEVAVAAKEGYNFWEKHVNKVAEPMEKLIEGMNEISNKLNHMESRLSNKLDVMVQTLLRRLPLTQKLNDALNELHNYIVGVDRLYDNFVYYSNNSYTFNNVTIKRFINTVTSDDPGSLQDIIYKMFRLVIPGRTGHIKDSLLFLISQQTAETYQEICDANSPQQNLYELYESLVITELRTYAMVTYAFAMLPIFTNEPYDTEIDRAEAQFAIRAEKYLQAVHKAMSITPRDIRRCDPPKNHQRNETFYEFEYLFNSVIISEPDVNYGSCKDTCETMTSTISSHCTSDFCYSGRQACLGRITNCRTIRTHIEVCATPNLPRRYQWYKDGYGTMYGDGAKCQGEMKYIRGWNRGFVYCDYCICDCESLWDQTQAYRAISLEEQIADIKNNKVITGVKFAMKGRMMHLQIKEGKLLPQGEIADAKWKELSDVQYEQSNYRYYKKVGTLRKLLNDGKDYFNLLPTQRTVNLDDVTVPEDYVVTGIRIAFAKAKTWFDDHLPFTINVMATKFDYFTGELETENSKWFTPSMMNSKPYKRDRTEVFLSEPDDPLKSSLNLLNSQANQFVKFRGSDLKKDAGGTTVPYLDAQSVEATPGFPLSGVGLLYKGASGFGGFVAPRVFTTDISKYFNINLDEVSRKKYMAKLIQPRKKIIHLDD